MEIFLLLLSYVAKEPKILLWNRTASVPLGIYRVLSINTISSYRDDMGKAMYVALRPQVLDCTCVFLTPRQRTLLQGHRKTLTQFRVSIIKKLSETDKRYVLREKTIPSHIIVQSQNEQGIDSRIFGAPSRKNVIGVYELVYSYD